MPSHMFLSGPGQTNLVCADCDMLRHAAVFDCFWQVAYGVVGFQCSLFQLTASFSVQSVSVLIPVLHCVLARPKYSSVLYSNLYIFQYHAQSTMWHTSQWTTHTGPSPDFSPQLVQSHCCHNLNLISSDSNQLYTTCSAPNTR